MSTYVVWSDRVKGHNGPSRRRSLIPFLLFLGVCQLGFTLHWQEFMAAKQNLMGAEGRAGEDGNVTSLLLYYGL